MTQIYVDDIIFGATSTATKDSFMKMMQSKFEMSLVRELSYFLESQSKQLEDGTFLSQKNYARNLVKFDPESSKPTRTHMVGNGKNYAQMLTKCALSQPQSKA